MNKSKADRAIESWAAANAAAKRWNPSFPSTASADFWYAGTCRHSASIESVTSTWNWTPYAAAPNRNAWFG